VKQNIGNSERVLRIVIGAALAVAAAMGMIGWWGWLGLIPLVTGLVGWCPPYALLGISTCKTKPA
jgi:hypothetical protein